MDVQQYFNLQQYLKYNKIPDEIHTTREKKKFINMAKHFTIQESLIYKFNKRKIGHLLKVLKKHELEPILYMMHNDPTAGHFGIEIMFNKIRERYYWPQMYNDIKEYVRSCDSCQRRGKPSRNNELHPIPPHSPFYQVGIDFVGPLLITPRGNRYIIVAIDLFTKWSESRAVAEANASQVSQFVYEDIICRYRCL